MSDYKTPKVPLKFLTHISPLSSIYRDKGLIWVRIFMDRERKVITENGSEVRKQRIGYSLVFALFEHGLHS